MLSILLRSTTVIVIGKLASLAMQTLVAHRVSTADVGLFNFWVTAVTIASIVTALGFPISNVRFVATYVLDRRWGLLRTYARVTLGLVAALSALCAGVIAVAVHAADLDPHERLTALAALVALVPLSLMLWVRGALQGLDAVSTAVAPRDVLTPIFAIGLIVMLPSPDAPEVTAAFAVAVVMALGLGSLWLYRSTPRQVLSASPDPPETMRWLVVSFPMSLTNLSRVGLDRFDIVALGIFATMTETGIYSVAVLIANAPIVFVQAAAFVTGPRLARAHRRGEKAELRRVFGRAALFSATSAAVAFAVLWIFAEPIMGLFGPDYVAGAPLLQILAIGRLANTACGPTSMVLQMIGAERLNLGILATISVLTIVGLAFAVPFYGAVGAAVTTATGLVVLSAAWLVAVYWKIGRSR